MCGIAGWYPRRPTASLGAVLSAQLGTIVHRGPDDQGVLVDRDCAIGMRRLSIIDLPGGHQPMDSPDGRYAIVFNGEIYNYRELRDEFAAQGRAFATHSDTEVILAGFELLGDAVWPRLDGMFAVALWDRRERRLRLARDQLGIKPLYVTEQAGGLAFASELKALMALPGHDFPIDGRALHDVFTFGHVRKPRSIYASVRTLAPGHLLTIDAAGPARERAFWEPRYVRGPSLPIEEQVAEFRERWLATVQHQMLADVEVGAFLSGGVDSSAVVAAMTRIAERPVRTFTIGFPVARYDESAHAEAIARHLGTIHVTEIVDLAAATDILPTIQRCYDEPFADPAAVPTWYLSRLAARSVKVALSGDGGDEVFLGYKRHRTEQKIAGLPAPVRALARAAMALPQTRSASWNYRVQRWQKVAASAALPDGFQRFFAKTQITSAAFRARVYDAEFWVRHEGDDPFGSLADEYFPEGGAISADPLEQFAYADLTLNLPGAMLTKVDRASMAHSLEVRVPMLGTPLVQWALSLPTDAKLRGGVGKYVVRKAVEPWLPPGCLDRRKQGFQMPLAEWFAGDFGGYARSLWHDSDAAALGVLQPAAVEAVFAEHRAGARDHSRFLYALAMVSLWWADRHRGASLPRVR